MNKGKKYFGEIPELEEVCISGRLIDLHRQLRRACKLADVSTYRVADYTHGYEGEEVVYERDGCHWNCVNQGDWCYDSSLEYHDDWYIRKH